MSRKTVLLRSSPHPNGVSWVANAALALGVPVAPTKSLRRSWKIDTFSGKMLPRRSFAEEYSSLLVIPSEIPISSNRHVALDHTWPYIRSDNEKCILVWRDPVQALYADFLRHQSRLESYGQKYEAFGDYIHSLDPSTGLSPHNLWASYYEAWLLSTRRPLVIEFESLKTAPIESITRIAYFLNTCLAEDQVEHVAEMANTRPRGATRNGSGKDISKSTKVTGESISQELVEEIYSRTRGVIATLKHSALGYPLQEPHAATDFTEAFRSDLLELSRSPLFLLDSRLKQPAAYFREDKTNRLIQPKADLKKFEVMRLNDTGNTFSRLTRFALRNSHRPNLAKGIFMIERMIIWFRWRRDFHL